MQIIKRLQKYLLFAILLLAVVLRTYQLPSNPPHLTPDEAALGYSAYSILKTGKDEYGKFLPVIFKSFGDYKPGLYVYATVPFVALLGLNELSARLPSAVAGVVAVFLIYRIIKEFGEEKLAYVASFLLAINPWHIYFSRGAWEVNLCLTLTLAGIYFFLVSQRKKIALIPSAIFFALTLITYQGAKLSTALVLFILVVIYRKELLEYPKKFIFSSVVLALIVALPIILSLFSNQAGRLSVFSVFSYPRAQEVVQAQLAQGNEMKDSISYFLFHSETLNFTRGILGRYFNHYSDRFLFFEGDWQNLRHSPPNHGMFFLADLVLLVFGFVFLARKTKTKLSVFIFLWLVLAPLPSILSRDQVHAVRSYNLLVPIVVINSMGAIFLVDLLRNFFKTESLKYITSLVGILVYSLSFIYFLDAYFVHLPKHNAKYWMYGYKQIVEFVTPIQSRYTEIRVQQDYAQPYIYFLFFQKYDPAKYQSQANLIGSGIDVGKIEKLDNIEFTQMHWTPKNGKALVIPNAASVIPSNATILREIFYPDGFVAFRISETPEK